MTRDPDADAARSGDEAPGAGWMPAERALLEAALDFYDAAQGVIDYAGRERPQLRHDAAAFDAVRQTMGALEERMLAAHAAGATPARIAQIARMDQEMVELILERRSVAPRAAGRAGAAER